MRPEYTDPVQVEGITTRLEDRSAAGASFRLMLVTPASTSGPALIARESHIAILKSSSPGVGNRKGRPAMGKRSRGHIPRVLVQILEMTIFISVVFAESWHESEPEPTDLCVL